MAPTPAVPKPPPHKERPRRRPYAADHEDIDPECLLQACKGVMVDLYCHIDVWAEHYAVPEDVLAAMVTDWLVSEQMGTEPCPPSMFIPEKNDDSEH